VATLINADAKEIVFTSGATECNNIAIKGVARFYKAKKNHIITTQTVRALKHLDSQHLGLRCVCSSFSLSLPCFLTRSTSVCWTRAAPSRWRASTSRTCQSKRMASLTSRQGALLYETRDKEYSGLTLSASFSGTTTAQALEAAIRPETALVSVMAVNNEIGVMQPLAEIGTRQAVDMVLARSFIS